MINTNNYINYYLYLYDCYKILDKYIKNDSIKKNI